MFVSAQEVLGCVSVWLSPTEPLLRQILGRAVRDAVLATNPAVKSRSR